MRTLQFISAVCAAAFLCAAVPPAPESPVADAAMRGDRDAVRRLLRQGADANAAQADGMTALHWAAHKGDVELARMLIRAGGRPEATTRIGHYTPLHLASRAGNADLVAALLEAGANPKTTTSSGGATPLHLAAGQGNADAVRALLKHGAEVDARESAWAQTPLMWAAAYDRVAALRVLIQHGAAVGAASKVEDISEREKVDRAALQQRTRRMAALRAAERPPQQAERAQPPAERPPEPGARAEQPAEEAEKKPEETRPENEATKQDSASAPQEPPPLSYGDLVGSKGGLTPLHFAARQGHEQSVRALLDAGADIDRVSEGDHSSPLLVATINGHFDLAKRLLERGADPKLASDAGATPLYAAINVQWAAKSLYPQPTSQKQQRTTYLELMEALLEAGADPNVRLSKHLWYMSYNFDLLGVNTAGATPFWRAAYGTDVEAMRLLIAHGADPQIPTVKASDRRRRADAPAEEEDNGEDPSGLPPVPIGGPAVWPIHAASGVGYGEGYAANAHRHAPDGWLPAVKYLVEELGADVNARDHNGYNAVHHAAARGDNELILYLFEKGAEVTALSRKGQTTADMANGPVQRVSPFLETVALLEKLGAKNNNRCRSC